MTELASMSRATPGLVRRLILLIALSALVASGCSSGSDADVAATDDTGDAPAAADGDGEESEDATSIPVPGDDAAAQEAIAGLDGSGEIDPAPIEDLPPDEVVVGFLRNSFNIDPETEWVDCILSESDAKPDLAAAVGDPGIVSGGVDDAELRALTTAMNGCVATISLADWATQAIGPRGDVADSAPPCLVDRFEADQGDLVFYNFVALTYQYRLEPSATEGLTDALVECAPITSLSEFFAEQAEQFSGFSTVVDRECLNDVLSPPEVSREFWDSFVSGLTPPVEIITPYADGCSSDPSEGFDDAVPADFEPWSGDGALASVLPAARNGVYTAPPPASLDPEADYQAVVATGGGEIRIDLFADAAPLTVNNFVSLARDGFFDGTIFHRVLDGFMAQGGDPTGSGTGGPGYQFVNEVDGPALDKPGMVAMANSGPDTNGSQFFITFVETDWLTGDYSVFGEVVEGMDIVNAIERREPSAPTGPGQRIDSITIIEN